MYCSIKYLHVDKAGKEVWTPLLSDWDLDTAILGKEVWTPPPLRLGPGHSHTR